MPYRGGDPPTSPSVYTISKWWCCSGSPPSVFGASSQIDLHFLICCCLRLHDRGSQITIANEQMLCGIVQRHSWRRKTHFAPLSLGCQWRWCWPAHNASAPFPKLLCSRKHKWTVDSYSGTNKEVCNRGVACSGLQLDDDWQATPRPLLQNFLRHPSILD